MRLRPWCALSIVILVLASAPFWGCRAQTPAAPVVAALEPVTYAAAFFAKLAWRNIGPNRGGRSIACTGVPGRPLEAYFGAVGGGLWKTVDGGTTWRPVTDGQIKSSSVGAVVVSPSNPDVVYMGMGEVCLRGNIMQGDGVYKSTDAGKTWAHVGLADSQVISEIQVHPRDPDLVYAGAFGHPAGPNDERGVFRSKDGGKTWDKVLFRDNKTGVVDLVMDPKNPSVLYAALWEAYRVAWQMSSGGPGSGLFKSTDGGTTWTELTRNPGMPAGIIGRIGIAVSGADSRRIYAIVEAAEGGVFRSDDAGATWTKVNDERRLRQRAFYYTHIYADPKNRDLMYVLNTGFYKSVDGGKNYTTIEVPHGDNHDLWIDPANPLHMVNANDGGGNVSWNGGETWTDQRYPTAQLYHVATTKDFPYHVCGAQQDNTTICVASDDWESIRPPARPSGEYMYAVGGGESGYITPHPTDPNIFYSGSQGALLTRFDRRNGQTRDVQPFPRFFSGESSSVLPERWQWTFPIVFSPHDSKVIYTCSQHVWRSSNEGQSWDRISPDLTRADPKTLGDSGGPITRDQNGPEIYATVFALAPSTLEANTIWAGSDDGLIHVTRNGGKNWENVTPKDLPPSIRVSIIDASAHSAGTAYFAAKHYLQDDRSPYIYKSHDYGQTWTKIVKGIRADDYAHAVRADPKRAGLLYAGTEHGIYVSFDDGQNWQSLGLNLPDTQVSDIVVEEKDLVIGTHGRSMYVLDDIAVLRQLTPEIANANVHLFASADTYRPVDNALIDYCLKQAADKVTIEIIDKAGTTVRTFVGTPEFDQKPPRLPFASRAAVIPTPPTKAGLNRFIWDLRYPAATPIPNMFMRGASPEYGPRVVPGTYQVRLTASGQTLTQPLTVKLDPRVTGVTDADLQAQLDLALKVGNRTTEAHEAVLLARTLKDEIKNRVASASDLASAGEALATKLTDIEGEIYQYRLASNQDLFHHPIKLNNRLAGLERVIESAEAKPTDQSITMFEELSKELDGILTKLDQVLRTEVAAFNTQLADKKLEAVTAKRGG